MRQITVIVEQINHCKNLIRDNDTSNLRMALILLDNAAEILMYRKVRDEFCVNETYKKIVEHAKSTLPPSISSNFLADNTIPEILKEKEKRNILRYFDEKVSFLCKTCSLIPAPVAAVLSSLHRYRNETYHRDIIRNEILHPIAILYFEIVCELMTYLEHSGKCYSSVDDWSPFFKKYSLGNGKDRYRILSEEDIEAILNTFRVELSLDLNELKGTLQAYISNRLDRTMDKLRFISETLGGAISTTIKLVQFTSLPESTNCSNRELLLRSKEFNAYNPPIKEEHFTKWKTQLELFSNISEKLDLFIIFKQLEDQFEPFEHKVHEVADELDMAIQHYIDLARGK